MQCSLFLPLPHPRVFYLNDKENIGIYRNTDIARRKRIRISDVNLPCSETLVYIGNHVSSFRSIPEYISELFPQFIFACCINFTRFQSLDSLLIRVQIVQNILASVALECSLYNSITTLSWDFVCYFIHFFPRLQKVLKVITWYTYEWHSRSLVAWFKLVYKMLSYGTLSFSFMFMYELMSWASLQLGFSL
jgi:hypothetical protein